MNAEGGDMNATFDRLMNLDRDVRHTHVQIMYGQNIPKSRLDMRKEKFYAALEALTPEEFAAFKEYRREVMS
jgi:hypothetical protein